MCVCVCARARERVCVCVLLHLCPASVVLPFRFEGFRAEYTCGSHLLSEHLDLRNDVALLRRAAVCVCVCVCVSIWTSNTLLPFFAVLLSEWPEGKGAGGKRLCVVSGAWGDASPMYVCMYVGC